MTVQSRQAVSQASEGWLGHDRLQQRSDELAQQAPGLRAGQATRGRPSARRGKSWVFIDERLKQKDDEEIGRRVRLGGALVGAGQSFEADQSARRLKPGVDPPSQAIKRKDVGEREGLGRKRGHEDHPLRRSERSLGDLMTMLSCFSARLPPRGFGGLPGFLDGDEAQGERPAALASNGDRPVDQPGLRGFAEFGEKIDRLAIGVEPAGVPKSRRGSARQPPHRARRRCGRAADRRDRRCESRL